MGNGKQPVKRPALKEKLVKNGMPPAKAERIANKPSKKKS